jgi:hypothetical protein
MRSVFKLMVNSSNNKPKTKEEEQTIRDKMKVIDFMPHWKDEEKCFEDAGFVTDVNTGRKTDQIWTRQKPMTQLNYERWLEKTIDPDTGEWNQKRDKDGNVVNNTGGRYVVSVINRVKVDKNEFLLSKGFLKGYDLAESEVVNWCSYPERWTRTLFDYKRTYDPDKMKFESQLLGPNSKAELVYSLPFSPEAVDKLMESTDPENVELNVLDAKTGEVTRVEWSDRKQSLKLFKEKSFETLMMASYIPEPVRQELRQIAEQKGLIPKSYPPTTTTATRTEYLA